MKSFARAILTLIGFVLLPMAAMAGQPTQITVRVLANDAKLIGTVAGGTSIVIRDALTGSVLAEGIQLGSTGSTDAIIKNPWVRGESRFDSEGAASFTTTLDLDHPTRILVEARGPLGFPGNEFRASRELLVVPGQAIEGDGIVLTLQGLVVNLLAPHAEIKLESGAIIEIEAGVKLLCTCPIEPDGLWDSNDYEVRAQLWRGGTLRTEVPLTITEHENIFAGTMSLPTLNDEENVVHELRIIAGNPNSGNWGSDHRAFRLTR